MNAPGVVHVVNDFHRRCVYNRNGEGGGGAVVLSFDVVRPEYVSCRSSLIRHRGQMLRVLGTMDTGGGASWVAWRHLWRSFSLSLLSNLG
jgi:hypothetical protein